VIHLSQETLALARRLAAAHNISLEDAVKLAVENSAREAGVVPLVPKARDTSPRAVAARKAGIDAIVDSIAGLPVLDRRSAREIMDDINGV
jgi:antitoxin VapB